MTNLDKKYDSIIPSKRWEFNEAVTNCFDNMLERSVPGYNRMRELVFEFGKEFVQEHTTIVDIGCSLGNAIYPFVEKFNQSCHFVGIEPSSSMVVRARERYQKEIELGIVEIFEKKVEEFVPKQNVSLILSVLTLQFVNVEDRYRVVQELYTSLVPQGAMILVEKTNSANFDLFEKIYYNLKRKNGYSEEQIYSKKESLSNCLVPLSREENVKMLKMAGFKNVECIWTDIMFSAWIAIKE